jgi:hypothetical protein
MNLRVQGSRFKVQGWALLVALICAAGVALADGLSVLKQLTKTNSSTSTPVRVGTTRGTYFKSATFYGKSAVRTSNTGTVYLGTNSTNDTQSIEVTAGGWVVISASPGSYLDLYDIYLDVGTANDGVVVVYESAP